MNAALTFEFSETPRLPVFDLALANGGGTWLNHLAAQIDWAAAEFGFFYVVNHGVDRRLVAAMHGAARQFFALSAERKGALDMAGGGRAWRGYFPVGGELTSGKPDLKEGLYLGTELGDDDPRVRAGLPLHGRNLFPDIIGFRETTLTYLDAVTRLAQQIASGLGRGLGVGEHTDYGFLTLLWQDNAGGLQVRHGDEWLDVPYLPDSFVVNVGDMLERLTGGRYVSALHRVVNASGRQRISMPLFFDPRFDAVLEPIPGVTAAPSRRELAARWDGLDLTRLSGTYGEYLISKVSKVFPDLGRAQLAAGDSVIRV